MTTSRQIISRESIEILEQFGLGSNVNVPPVNEAAKTLLRELQTFSQMDENEQATKIDSLRKLFLTVYDNKELPIAFVMDMDFKKLLYNILITLGEKFPVNDIYIDPEDPEKRRLPIDPILYIPILENDQFCTITGQIFSIDSIIKWNRDRPEREAALEEKHQEKFLLNPLTNQPFLPMDMERLLIIATTNNKNLDFIIDQPSDSNAGNAELTQAYSLKDLVSLSNGISQHRTVNLDKDFHYTTQDAIACMSICAQNNETKTFGHLYNSLSESGRSLLSNPDALETNVILTKSGAYAFICLLIAYDEPKTLRNILDVCIACDVDLNHPYGGGIAAVHIAAQYGSVEAMNVLLEPQYKIDINRRDAAGATAVNIATHQKKNNIVKMLADKGANLMVPRYDGKAPIHKAAEDNNAELMTLLLAHQVQINQKSKVFSHTKTAAHFAAESNSKEVTEMLLDAKADFNILSDEGLLPVHYAAFHGSIDVMRVLLQRKDKTLPDQPIEGQASYTVATVAAEKGHVSILELLAEAKVDLTKPRMDDGTTPLHRAVLNDHPEAVKFLIENYLINQTNIFIKHDGGQSPFLFACATKRWDIAKLFLNRMRDEEIPEEDKALMNIFREELGLPAPSISNGELLTRFGSFAANASTPQNQEPVPAESKNEQERSHRNRSCVLP